MSKQRMLLGAGIVAGVAVVIVVGIILIQSNSGQQQPLTGNTSNPGAIATVNGTVITQDQLDVEYNALLNAYRPAYQESGNNLDDFLVGPDGGYNKLQLQFQALERLINKKVAEQRLMGAGLYPTENQVNARFEEKYQAFLSQLETPETAGMDLEEAFKDVFETPQRLSLAQELLGFSDTSFDGLQARLRLEADAELRFENLWRIAFGSENDLDLDDQASLNRITSWIENEVAVSDIEYHDPLFQAHAIEVQISSVDTLDDRSDLLAGAIGLYESLAEEQGESAEVNFERILNRLYDLKVNWDLQLERELIQKAQDNIDAQRELEEVQEEILINRRKAQSSISPEDSQNEDALRFKLQSDNNNPLYYYLLAKVLMQNVEEEGTREVRNLLFAALNRDDEYIDAMVLQGDLNMYETKYLMAIEDYQGAYDLFDEVSSDSENAIKYQDHPKDIIQRKLAESYVGRAGQLDTMNEPPADAAEQRAFALTTARTHLQDLLNRKTASAPDYPFLLIAMGDLERLSGNLESARDLYIESLEFIDDLEVTAKLGNVYLELGNLDEARTTFEGALEADQFFAKAHLGLAHVFKAEGNIPQALVKYEDAFKYGVNLEYLERYAIAQEALELDPNNISMRLRFADFLADGNVHTAAMREYGIILDQDNSVRPAYVGLGKVHSKKLEYMEAIEAFRGAEGLSDSVKEEIETYELLRTAERGRAGAGKPMLESGQEVVYQLAILYLQDGRLIDSFNMLGDLASRYPDFRSEEVAELRRQLTRTAGDSLPGVAVASLGNQVITPGEDHPGYNSTPPTSGWHYAVPAPWGFHSTSIQNEIQVRNLALGGVLIQYNPDLVTDEDLQAISTLVSSMRETRRAYCPLLVAPYENSESSIVLTAWNRIYELEAYDRGKVVSFIDAFIGRGPNAGEVSCLVDFDSTGLNNN